MILATLVYVRHRGRTLMIHRNKRPNDMHLGKWNGLGGKLEPGETPEACAVREVREESGLRIAAPELRGILTFPDFQTPAPGQPTGSGDWMAFVFVAPYFEGMLIDPPEGTLDWIPDAALLTLPLWDGDRVFLPWLDQPLFFSARFDYTQGVFAGWEATFYAPGGAVARSERGAPQPPLLDLDAPDVLHPPTLPAQPPATPSYRDTQNEDACCWLCGAPAIKRHCKITCPTCGFTRDCSDP